MVGRQYRLPLSLCDFEGLAVQRGVPRPADPRLVTAELARAACTGRFRTGEAPRPFPVPLGWAGLAGAGLPYALGRSSQSCSGMQASPGAAIGPRPSHPSFAVSHYQVRIQPADDVRPPTVLAAVVAQYVGGALYYAPLSLPHLGNFTVTARLGTEPIGDSSGSKELALAATVPSRRCCLDAMDQGHSQAPQSAAPEVSGSRLGPISRRRCSRFNSQARRCISLARAQPAWSQWRMASVAAAHPAAGAAAERAARRHALYARPAPPLPLRAAGASRVMRAASQPKAPPAAPHARAASSSTQ